MNRRDFVRFSATAGSMAAASLPLWAAQRPSDLLNAPQRFVGEQFYSDSGATLTLENAEAIPHDKRLRQWSLSFRSDRPLTEGTHYLRSQSAGETPLFMQCTGTTAHAYISQLA